MIASLSGLLGVAVASVDELIETYLNVTRPQFSMAENPKSGTATMSIFGKMNGMPKYSL